MTLLSPLALLVGLTAVVPLVLHLYQQRRRTVVEFSSNRFFTKSVIRSQRRLRLRRLLLLVLRMAVCLLLALALARPVMTLAGFGGRAGTRDVVIVLDDSLSMQARDGAGLPAQAQQTRFEHARRLAVEALSELTTGDRAAVITFSGRLLGDVRRVRRPASGVTTVDRLQTGPTGDHGQQTGSTGNRVELTGDLLGLVDEVERLQPTFAAGDAHAALARAAELFQDATPRNRLLLLLSDLQAGDWRRADWPQPAQPIALALVPLGAGPGAPGVWNNVVADQLLLSQAAAVVGQPNLLQVRLVNYREQTTPAELVLEVDGQEQVRRPIELPGQSRHVERVPLEFEKPGEHRLRLHVQCGDALGADNTLYTRVRVNPRLPVLVIDGHAEAPAGSRSHTRAAAFFLRAALRAVSEEGDAIQVDTIRPDGLTAAALEGYRVVVLSEVNQLSVAQVDQLERFVQDGGGLAIFLGDFADRRFYNEIMGGPSRPLGGLLPADLLTLVEAGQTVEPLHILAAELDHPALQRFKGTLRSALAGVSVYRLYAVEPRQAWVLASLDRGLPLLVERSYGRGRVILCTAAPHPRWTNLPLRRVFVPLTNRLVNYLAGGGTAPAEHHAGNDLELLRGGWDIDRPVYVRQPNGVRLRAAVKVVGADPVAYVPAEQVTQPGFYVLEKNQERTANTVFAVNTPRRESTPDALDLDQATGLAGKWRVKLVDGQAAALGDRRTSGAARGSLLSSGWLTRGVWDTFLWTVFALLLAEPLIANQIIRFRRRQRDLRSRRAA